MRDLLSSTRVVLHVLRRVVHFCPDILLLSVACLFDSVDRRPLHNPNSHSCSDFQFVSMGGVVRTAVASIIYD